MGLDFWDKDLEVQCNMADEAASYFLDTLKNKLRRSRRGGGFDREKIEGLYIDDIAYNFEKFRFVLMYWDSSKQRDYTIESYSFNFFYQEYYDIYGSHMEPIKHEYAPETEKEFKEFMFGKVDDAVEELIRYDSYCLCMLRK